MREIKFKVWDVSNNKFTCCYQSDIRFTLDTVQIYINGTNFTDSFVLCQFTGLKDKNGVGIYENDLVNISGSGLCRVEIQPYCGVVYIEINEAMCGTDAHDVAMEKEDIFIVGNIYENKDLIEANK